MSRRPARTRFLPLQRPSISDEDTEAVSLALRSGWLSKGPLVARFEERLASFLDVPNVLATRSGTAALHLAMLAAGLGPGDELLVPSFSFAPTAGVALLVGASPVFVDLDPRTLCIDVEDARRKVTPRTRAVMALHFAGRPADLKALRALCDEKGLLLVEDAAHAFGAKSGHEWVGRHGDFVCFSFHATKPLTCGEGGALVTRSDAAARVARDHRWYGIDTSARDEARPGQYVPYQVVNAGYKYVLSDPQAALGLSQLDRFERFIENRRALAHRYAERLGHLSSQLELPDVTEQEGERHTWHLFVVRLRPDLHLTRSSFMEGLHERLIGTGVHYPPLHLEPLYARTPAPLLPITESIGSRVVSLPLFNDMSFDDVDDVCDAIEDVLARGAARP